MFDALVRSFQQMIESSLGDVNTQIPGTIVSYDAANNRAVVRPDLPKRIASGDSLAPPNIVEVPIIWPSSGGGKASFTMPLKAGDGVMLAFQQRSLEGWLSGNKQMPDDPRQFDLSDCVAIAGCSPSGIVAHPDDVLLKSDRSELRMTPDNIVILGNDKGSISMDGDGNVIIAGNSITVLAGGKHFKLEHHQHGGVQTGLGNTSQPVDT
jgi:hypothetical protein